MGDRRWWWNSEGEKSVKCVSSGWSPPCNGVHGHCLVSNQTPLHGYPSYCLWLLSSALTVHIPVCSPSEPAWFPTKIQTRKRINMNCHHHVLVAQLYPTLRPEAPLSMEFSRQEYWSGWPFPPPGDLPNPGIEAGSPALQAGSFTIWVTSKDLSWYELSTWKNVPADLCVSENNIPCMNS